MPHPVARRNTQALGAAGEKFEDGADGHAGRDARGRKRRGMGGDRGHPAVAGDKQHVERQRRVPHPHGDLALGFEIEQHAAIGVHLAPPHKADRALLFVARHLDAEQPLARYRLDGQFLERQFLLGAERRRRPRRQPRRSADEDKRQRPSEPRPAPAKPYAPGLHTASPLILIW